MTIEFWIAFGGPVLIGVLCYAFLALTRPRPNRAEIAARDSVTVRLADAERAARLAADEIARVRELMTAGSDRS